MPKVYEYENLMEKVYFKQMNNGLRVYVIPKQGYKKQYAIYATHYGSNDLRFRTEGSQKVMDIPEGTAHFLEHKMFEEQDGNVFNQFTELGAQANAYTNFTTTAYLFTSTHQFEKSLEVLLGFVNNPYFTDENVNKEKGIIEQEILMYEDNPEWRVFFNALGAMFHDHPVRKDIAGTVESIAMINKDILSLCYDNFYNPQNMVLLTVGDLEPQKIYDQVDIFFEDRSQGKGENRKKSQELIRIYPDEPKESKKKKIEQRLKVATPLFALGFKNRDNNYKGTELLKQRIETEICLELLMGKSSDLYNELYDKGLINASFSKSYTGEIGYGYSLITGESRNPIKVQQCIMDYLEKEGLDKVKDSDVERMKKKMMGELLRYYNSIDFIAHDFINEIFKGTIMFDQMDVIGQISTNDIRQRYTTHFMDNISSISFIHSK